MTKNFIFLEVGRGSMERKRLSVLSLRALISLLILALLVLPISILLSTGSEGLTNVTVNITIDGNTQLVSSPYRSPGGHGIAGDPYVFEDLAMNTHQINIINTDVYFVFRNITFSSSTSLSIYLENVKNACFSNISSNGRRNFLKVVGCTDITLERSNVINAPYSSYYLIKVQNTMNLSLMRSNFSKSSGLGGCIIHMDQYGGKHLMENNTFKNMYVYDRRFDDNERISNNTFINSSLILGYDTYNVEGYVSYNEFYNSTLDIRKAQMRCVIENNRFFNEIKNCIELDYTYECTISNNYLTGNIGIDFQNNIYSAGDKYAFINRNNFEGCHYGISTLNTNQHRPFSWDIYDNYFGNCSGYALNLGYALKNRIWHNSFYHNAGTDNTSSGDQAYHTLNYGNTWTNTYTVDGVGNFWANYRSPDIDNNGIVDDQLSIGVAGGTSPIDYAPFTNPYFDTTPPLISILNPLGLYEDNSYFILEWSANDPTSGIDLVKMKIDGGEPVEIVDSSKTSVYLERGDHEIELTVFNGGGLKSIVEKSLHVNSTVDIITINQPANGSFLRGSNRYIQWSIIAEYLIENLTILVNGVESFFETDVRDVTLELNDGEYIVIIRAKDIHGLEFERMVYFVVDNKAPTITINAPTPYSYLSNNDVHFNWDTYDRYGIAEQFIRYDEGDWMENTGASNAIWIFGTGPHTCDIKALDMAGNERIFNIPLFLGPDLRFELIEPSPDTYTRDFDLNLKWKYNGPLNWTSSLLQIGENGDFIDIGGAPEYPFKLNEDGEYLITIRLQDGFDNYAEASTTVVKDTTSPKVFFRYPSNNSVFNNGEIIITWRGEEEFGIREFLIKIDGGEWEQYGNTTEYEGLFEEGTHTIEVKAIDNAGNTGYELLNFSIDSQKPTVAITSPIDGVFTNGFKVEINWEIVESNAIRSITLTVNENTFVDLMNFTTYEYPTPKEGEYLFMITVVDLAGNSNSHSVMIYNDRTKPDIEWTDLPPSFTNRTSLDFSWRITEQYLRSVIFGYGDLKEDLSLHQTSISVEVEEGSYEFYLKAEDMMGNVFSISHHLLVDITPPTIIIDWQKTLIDNGKALLYWSTEDNGSSELFIEIDDGSGFMEALLENRYTSDKLAEGNHYISIRATDESGNTETITWKFFVNSQGGIGEDTEEEGSSVHLIIGIVVIIIILIVVILIFVNRSKRKKEERKEIVKAPSRPGKIQISSPISHRPMQRTTSAIKSEYDVPSHTSTPAPVAVQTRTKVSGEDSGYIRPRSKSSKKRAIRDKDRFKTSETMDKKRSKPRVEKEQEKTEKEAEKKEAPTSDVPLVDLPEDVEIRSWDDEEEIPSWDDSDEIDQDDVWKGKQDDFPQEIDDDSIIFDDDEMEEFEEFDDFE